MINTAKQEACKAVLASAKKLLGIVNDPDLLKQFEGSKFIQQGGWYFRSDVGLCTNLDLYRLCGLEDDIMALFCASEGTIHSYTFPCNEGSSSNYCSERNKNLTYRNPLRLKLLDYIISELESRVD